MWFPKKQESVRLEQPTQLAPDLFTAGPRRMSSTDVSWAVVFTPQISTIPLFFTSQLSPHFCPKTTQQGPEKQTG